MKLFTGKEILPISLILLVVILSLFLYPLLPDVLPSHWNARGEIDSWSGKNFTVLFYPCLIVAIYLLMIFIPLIDPLRRNYQKFALPYFWFRVVLVAFFTLLYLFTLWTGLGKEVNINYFILPALSVMFVAIGFFMPKIKKNYFVGIRTPWTLASEETWDKTHKLGGMLFMAAGIVSLLGLLFFDYAIQIFLGAILAAVLVSLVYSYFIFRKVEGFKNQG